MLYAPKWNDKKPDIWSLDNFINWISLHNPNKTYSYFCSGRCLIAQYLKSYGLKNVHVGSCSVYYRNSKLPRWISWVFTERTFREMPAGFNSIAYPFNGHSTSTFGDALKRAKELKARLAERTSGELVQ